MSEPSKDLVEPMVFRRTQVEKHWMKGLLPNYVVEVILLFEQMTFLQMSYMKKWKTTPHFFIQAEAWFGDVLFQKSFCTTKIVFKKLKI